MVDIRQDNTELSMEYPVTIVHGTEVQQVHLSSLLECIKLFELQYDLVPQQSGHSILQVYGPNKVLEFDIVEVTH